jgi:hypothetical protein
MLALVAVALLAMALPAAAQASCAATVEWDGVTYYGSGQVALTPGATLGAGEVPPCNDSDDIDEEATPVVIHRIRGVDPELAVVAELNGVYLEGVYVAEGRSVRIAGRTITAPVVVRGERRKPTNWLVVGLISAGALVPLGYLTFRCR